MGLKLIQKWDWKIVSLVLFMAVGFQNCDGFQSVVSKSSIPSSIPTFSSAYSLFFPGQNPGTGVYRPTDGVGTNTMLVSRYLNGKYGLCAGCPTHLQGMSLDQIQDSLSALTGTSLTQYREIIEMTRFFPAPGQLTNMDDLITILQLYQAQGATVMLTFGHPVPAWMNPDFASGAMTYDPSNNCFLPDSSVSWIQLKNNMSQALGLMMSALWTDPRLKQGWMASHILIDPYNEFDSVLGGPDCIISQYGTGQRAAALSGGMQFVLNQLQIPVIVTMPSGGTGSIQYFSDFYTSGGLAMANVHAYFIDSSGRSPSDPATNDDYVGFLIGYLQKVNAVVPLAYQNNLVLGEFGYLSQTPLCNPSNPSCLGRTVDGVAEQQYLLRVFNDPTLRSLAPIRMSWELVDMGTEFVTAAEMENMMTWGVERTDTSPKPSLYQYILQQDGIDIASDPTRYPTFRASIQSALQSAGLASPSTATVSAFFHDWIMEIGSWDDLVQKYAPAPVSPSPPVDPCSVDSAASQICAAYQTLYGRTADASGLAYWKSRLTSDGVTPSPGFPPSCWAHQIAEGTAGADCQTYMNRWAPHDSFGTLFGWVPSAGCALPQPLTGTNNYFAPACFVFPSSAQTPCPGSPDPAGTQTSSQLYLCQAYSELYQRAPDSSGYTYWLPQISGKSVACIKKALAPGTSASDCAAFASRYGISAPSTICSGSVSTALTFGCTE